MYEVDLNCDLGESFGNYKLGLDEEVILYIFFVNLVCGFYVLDFFIMNYIVELVKKVGVCVGVYFGLFDLVGFGRRNMNIF